MKKTAISWMLKHIRNHIPDLILMVSVDVIHALFWVIFALGTQQVIDSAVSGDQSAFLSAALQQAVICIVLIASLALFRHLKEKISANLDRSWKKHLLHILLHAEYEEVSVYHSGELVNRLSNDIRVMNDGLLSALPNLAALLTRLISALVVLLSMMPGFGFCIIGVGVLVLIVTALMRRKLKELHKKVSEADGKVAGFIQEALEKLLLVQAMDISSEMENRAGKLLDQRYEVQRIRKNVSLAANTGVSIFSYLASFTALFFCAYFLLNGRMTFGELTAVTQLVNQLRMPMVNLSGIFPQYVAMTAAAERLMELDALGGKQEPECLNADDLYNGMEYIGAEDLTFSYDRDIVLSSAEFSLPKGAFAVVTGPSGVGKSTVLKLMLGVFKAKQGRVFLKCKEERISLDRSTRRLFAYVPQGNLLFSGTLKENLLVVKPDATEEDLQRAVYVSAMDEYLYQLPQGLDTTLGENSAGLSEGQSQRLAIARAILGDAPILLLDEATSALDAATEELVLERIRSLSGKTCIAVTHRPAAVSLADWEIRIQEHKLQCIHHAGIDIEG